MAFRYSRSSDALVLLSRSCRSTSTRRDVTGDLLVSRVVRALAARPFESAAAFSSSFSSSSSSAPTPPSPPSPPPPPHSSSFTVDASSAALALRSKPTRDLLRSYLVLSACRVRPLVTHGEKILKISRALPPLRDLVVDPIIKKTFFAQFCGGETEAELGPCVARLRRQGIGAILDYAAEPEEGGGSSSSSSSSSRSSSSSSASEAAVAAAAAPPPLAVARTHEYGDEGLCDSNAGHVLRAIEAAAAAAASASAGAEGDGDGGAAAEASGAAFAAAAAATEAAVASPPPPSSTAASPTNSGALQNLLPSGYAAVKLTALTDPRVLVKLSACLREIDRLFTRFDADADGRVSREEFETVYKETFTDGDTPGRLDELWRYLSRGSSSSGGGEAEKEQERGGSVDRKTWMSRVRLRDLPSIVPRCRTLGPLAAASPTAEELRRLDNLMSRLRGLAAAAKEKNVRLLIDAEYSTVQPAIDAAALELMREFNKTTSGGGGGVRGRGEKGKAPFSFAVPTVYNTTQCYLRGAEEKLRAELELAAAEGFAWGGKLVRGAYIDSERRRAAAEGRISPCWGSLEETHECYDECARIAVEEGVFAAGRGGGEVLLATHNKASVSKAVDLLSRLEKEERPAGEGDPPSSRVSFGQLYGMSESLTLAIARAGRRAYVYLPYGPLGEVLPYLLRRALENSQMLSASSSSSSGSEAGKKPLSELDAVRRELKARAVAVFFPRDK